MSYAFSKTRPSGPRGADRCIIAQVSDGIDAIAIAFRNHLFLWGYSYGLVIHEDNVYAFRSAVPAINLNWYFDLAPQCVVGVYTPRASVLQIQEDIEAHFRVGVKP